MQDRPTPWRIVVVAVSAAVCLSTAACSDDSGAAEPDAGLQPLDGVESPVPVEPPSGSVTANADSLHFTTFDPVTRSVVALAGDYASLAIYDADRPNDQPQVFPLPMAASALVPAGDGTLLLPMRGVLGRVDLRSSENGGDPELSEVSIEGVAEDVDLLSASVLEDGRVAVGGDRGSIHILDAASTASQTDSETIDGLSSVDGLAATQYGLAALDRRQTSITQVDTGSASLGAALRAGTGAANMTTDPYGRILVTDAAGSQLLVYSSDDLLLRQQFPLGTQPWAVAYDDTSNVVWVSTPADNQVVGYTLDTGIPVEVGRFSTVRQPDSITVDSDEAMLFVGSAAGDGLQQIPIGDVD